MPAQRNYEVALKDYVDRYIALEDSERAKDYDALMQAIDNIAGGVSVNVNVSGSGLVFDTGKSALVHSNQLGLGMTALGEQGAGSGMYIPTIKWDSNGHITSVVQNQLDTTVIKNSINGVLGGAVYSAIEQEKVRAQKAEQEAVQTALAAGTEYSFTATLGHFKWVDLKQRVENDKITGLGTELIEIDLLTYDGYSCGVRGTDAGDGWLELTCDSVPPDDVVIRVIITSTVSA